MFKHSASVSVVLLALFLAGSPTRAEEPPAEDKGIWSQVVALYEKAKESGETAADDVYEWAREDLEAIGDWEYRVERFSSPTPTELEEKLNKLGTERWEVVWIDRRNADLIVTMKRPSRTWLNKLPLGQLIKAAAGGADGGGE